MFNTEELTQKIVADWFVNGARSDDNFVTVKDVKNKLAAFKQIARALGLPAQFEWDDALEAAELIADRLNARIEDAKHYDV